MNLPFDLTGQVAVVTGGGTGIGEATAKLLASFGVQVAITSRKLDNLERVADEMETASGTRPLVVRGDVRDETSCREIIASTVERFGRLDILVNNAGGSYMFPMMDTPVDKFDNNVALNLRGPFILIREAAPHMIRQGGGAIVNMSSGAGMTGVKGGVAYSAAKAGLQMLTRVTAAELGRHNIRCNAIAVGAVASEGALRSWARFGASAESMGSHTPLGRVGQPDDIAWGVVYFVSPMSSWVSGQTIAIDGGPAMGGLD